MHITMQPSYMSMYFPAQGILMALGKVIFGQPWAGILLATALMCAAICWMLQGWLPPTWALLGGLLAVLRLGLFSYWINTFESGGSIAALGGALVLGSLPRFIRQPRLRYSMLMAVGVISVALSRPYEGMLLCIPVLIVLLRWIFFSDARPPTSLLIRRTALPLAIVIAAGAWLGYYDYRNFGRATILPYTVDRATYAVAPYYIWQKARPEPVYRHLVMRRFYHENEADILPLISTPHGIAFQSLLKLVRGALFFTGLAFLPCFLMARRVLIDKRVRFLVIGILVLTAGMAIEIFLIPHYLAPFTASLYALGLMAMRHLRVWKPGGRPAGMALVRLMVTVSLLMGCVRVFAAQLHLETHEYPASGWADNWYGPEHYGQARADLSAKFQSMPGQQLVMVRYSATHNPLDEWVYNAGNIDGAKVVWAREMSPPENAQLFHYYQDRQVWLVQPDLSPASIQPYATPVEQAMAVR